MSSCGQRESANALPNIACGAARSWQLVLASASPYRINEFLGEVKSILGQRVMILVDNWANRRQTLADQAVFTRRGFGSMPRMRRTKISALPVIIAVTTRIGAIAVDEVASRVHNLLLIASGSLLYGLVECSAVFSLYIRSRTTGLAGGSCLAS